MSTQSEEGEPTSEPTDEERPESKIFYCEICQVPCMSSITLQTHFAGLKHKKKERILKLQREPVVFEEPQTVRRPLPINIKSLKDYVNDPERPEPLIGLEYVIEIRFKGRKEPSYECQLCEFNTEMVPMIEHLTGQRHRKTYLGRHHPDKGKRYPNEDRALYLKRVARLIEKEEGLKKYKCEFYERPCVPSAAAKRKGKGLFKHQNNPLRKRNALEYMNKKFEITSDTEATLVINIAQTLSDSLKTFCENRKAIAHIRTLPPLMKPGNKNKNRNKNKNKNQASEYDFMGEAPEYDFTDDAPEYEFTDDAPEYEPTNQASKHEPTKPFLNYIQGDKKWNEDDKRTWNQGYNWNIGNLTNGIVQLTSLLQQTSNISDTPDSEDSQMVRRISSSGVNANPATVSPLQSSFALQAGDVRCGINERMQQFNKPAPVNCQMVGRVLTSGVNAEDPATVSALQSSFPLQPGNVRCGINERMQQFNKPAPINRQMVGRVSSSGVNAKDPATVSALQSSFALQPGEVRCGINERMKQFNKPASDNCQSASASEKFPFFTSPRGSHPTRQYRGNGTKVPNNRMLGGRIRPWGSMRDSSGSRDCPLAPVSYPIPRGYQTNYPSQGFPSWCGDGSMSGTAVSAPSENSTDWPQRSNFRGGVRFYPPFSGNRSCSNYQQLNTQLNNLISGSNSGFTANIMSQLRGKDVATLTAMLQQLVPHYPDLQKIDIHALARALSEMS